MVQRNDLQKLEEVEVRIEVPWLPSPPPSEQGTPGLGPQQHLLDASALNNFSLAL